MASDPSEPPMPTADEPTAVPWAQDELVAAVGRGDVAAVGRMVAQHAGKAVAVRGRVTGTLLHEACMSAQSEVALALLRRDEWRAIADTRNKIGQTALAVAAGKGLGDVCGALLATDGVDVNSQEDFLATPLHRACSGGHAGVVQLLLTHGADVTRCDKKHRTPLHLACAPGVPAACGLALLAAGANPHAVGHAGRTPLLVAAARGDEDDALVRALQAVDGVDVAARDTGGSTALHRACGSGHVALVRWLLAHDGAGVAGAAVANEAGDTPVHCAAQGGHAAVLRVLHEYGAAIDEASATTAQTPLLHACAHGHHDAVHALLAAGARLDATGHGGHGVLHAALHTHHNVALVRELLAAGASVLAENDAGHMCVQDALVRAHWASAELLRVAAEAAGEDAWQRVLVRRCHASNDTIVTLIAKEVERQPDDDDLWGAWMECLFCEGEWARRTFEGDWVWSEGAAPVVDGKRQEKTMMELMWRVRGVLPGMGRRDLAYVPSAAKGEAGALFALDGTRRSLLRYSAEPSFTWTASVVLQQWESPISAFHIDAAAEHLYVAPFTRNGGVYRIDIHVLAAGVLPGSKARELATCVVAPDAGTVTTMHAAHGVLYAGTLDGHVVGVDMARGTELWRSAPHVRSAVIDIEALARSGAFVLSQLRVSYLHDAAAAAQQPRTKLSTQDKLTFSSMDLTRGMWLDARGKSGRSCFVIISEGEGGPDAPPHLEVEDTKLETTTPYITNIFRDGERTGMTFLSRTEHIFEVLETAIISQRTLHHHHDHPVVSMLSTRDSNIASLDAFGRVQLWEPFKGTVLAHSGGSMGVLDAGRLLLEKYRDQVGHVNMFIEFGQLIGFVLSPTIAWSVEINWSVDLLEVLRFQFGSADVLFWGLTWTLVMLLALFIFLFHTIHQIERGVTRMARVTARECTGFLGHCLCFPWMLWRYARHPLFRNRRAVTSVIWHFYRAMFEAAFYASLLLSSVFFVPVLTRLLRVYDCTSDGADTYHLHHARDVECFTPSHTALCVFVALLVPLFVSAATRLAAAGYSIVHMVHHSHERVNAWTRWCVPRTCSDLAHRSIATALWPDRSVYSLRTGRMEVVLVAVKTINVAALVLARTAPVVFTLVVLCTSVATCAAFVRIRPHHHVRVNVWRFSLLVGAMWADVCGLVAAVLDDEDNPLPAILLFAITLPLVGVAAGVAHRSFVERKDATRRVGYMV